ncbi:AMED_5909 family protein [Saccharothrix ecbatanensis]|uniref:AMED_5909 family protein n=1 Tax=Saccharothrix ecbatanensis TaxID=1105145 RepID=UPI0035E4483C
MTPPPDASPDQRRAFHEYAAGIYRRVAETDRDHHYEAMAYAYVEQEIYATRASSAEAAQATDPTA